MISSADDVRCGPERREDHSGARDECRSGAGRQRARHVPGVGGDESYLGEGDSALLGHVAVGGRCRLGCSHAVGRQRRLEQVAQAGMAELGVGDLCGRVGERDEPQRRARERAQRLGDLGMRR